MNCSNNDLPKTSINSAYQFTSFSNYIINGGLKKQLLSNLYFLFF